jgi:hypothetical protein
MIIAAYDVNRVVFMDESSEVSSYVSPEYIRGVAFVAFSGTVIVFTRETLMTVDVMTGVCANEFRPLVGDIANVYGLANGQTMIVFADHSTVYENTTIVYEFPREDFVLGVHPNGVLSQPVGGGRLRITELSTFTSQEYTTDSYSSISDSRVSSVNGRIAIESLSPAKEFTIYVLENGSTLVSCPCNETFVCQFAISPNGDLVVFATERTIVAFNVQTRSQRLFGKLDVDAEYTNIEFLDDDRVVAMAGQSLYVYDTITLQRINVIEPKGLNWVRILGFRIGDPFGVVLM